MTIEHDVIIFVFISEIITNSFLKITLKENEKEKIYNICRRRTIRDCPTKIQDL